MEKRRKLITNILIIICMVSLLAALTTAIVVGFTMADRPDSPESVLNYEAGKLYWAEADSRIDENGVYRLSLFDSLPEGEDGQKIVAPGDTDKSIIRLINRTANKIFYRAVIYKLDENDAPIKADFTNIPENKNTSSYTLPEGVEKADVVRAVSGTIYGNELQDFDLEWIWEFSTGEEGDIYDTLLGNSENRDVVLGVWFTVTDEEDTEVDDKELNLDVDGDQIPDINIDVDNDGEPEFSLDIDGDRTPDINIDTDGNGQSDINIDINGDLVPDINLDGNGDGKPDSAVVKVTVNEEGIVVFPNDKTFDYVLDIFPDGEDMVIKTDNVIGNVGGVELPADALGDIAEGGGGLQIIMTCLKVELDNTTLRTIVAEAVTDVIRIDVRFINRLDLNKSQRDSIEFGQFAAAVRAQVISGDKIISDFGGGSVKIHMPYAIKPNTELADYKLYYLNDKTDTADYIETLYENGFFIYTVTHFSEYALIYNGSEYIGDVDPTPHVCNCVLICFFGGECEFCVICWLILCFVALAVISGIAIILYRKFD